jgi:acyl-CoA synthetase (AMP-forming)/AMP-acid ligase II
MSFGCTQKRAANFVLRPRVYPPPFSHPAFFFSLSQAVKDKGCTLFSFDELKKLGVEKPVEPVPPSPEDLCTIMYTSGTTGEDRGRLW